MTTNDTPIQDLASAQLELENRASSEGHTRFVAHQQSIADNAGDHSTVEGAKLIKGSIAIVAEQIASYISSANNGGKGKTPMAYSVLKDFDPAALAYVALKNIYTGTIKSRSLLQIHADVGNELQNEVIGKRIEAERNSKVASRIKQQIAKQGSSRGKVAALRKLAKDNLNSVKLWPADAQVKIAEPLVNAVLTALSDIFELHTVYKGKNDSLNTIRLTEKAVEWLASLKDASAWNNPIHRPMVVLPRRWEALDTGCYYDAKTAASVHLVRSPAPELRHIIAKAIENGEMDYVLDGINAIQETPWAINSKVLDVVRFAYENNISIEGLPKRLLLEVPPKVEPEVWATMDDHKRKGLRLDLAGIHEQNRRIVGERAVIDRDLEIAEDLVKYDRFYLPQNMDFRGRVYPVCHFNNQRSDHIRALFQFADGEPLGEQGAAWLAVHLANCGDFDKVSKKSFDERLQWVFDNEQDILDYAADPLGTRLAWSEAGSPFCFLAACFEYAAWVEGGRSEDFVSHIPVALDGSNSGLQHYSSAMRSREEAALVSLVPLDGPTDLYQLIADVVTVEVEADLKDADELTRLLAGVALENGITRKLVKRNVMTYAYSSAQFGFRNQILEDTIKPMDTQVLIGKRSCNPYAIEKEDGTLDGGFKVANYLAGKIYRAVTRTVSKAEEGMTFFKQVAGVLAHEGQPLIWRNPLGMPVIHKYPVWEMKRIELFLTDRAIDVADAGMDKAEPTLRRMRANLAVRPTARIDKSKARSAVAPNVIHSMDAAHLLLTVIAAKDEGYRHFALIHDSFGTHAGKLPRFAKIIREAFVEMYESYCPFEEVLEAAKAVLDDTGAAKLPALPEKGNFDLREVLSADYAFA